MGDVHPSGHLEGHGGTFLVAGLRLPGLALLLLARHGHGERPGRVPPGVGGHGGTGVDELPVGGLLRVERDGGPAGGFHLCPQAARDRTTTAALPGLGRDEVLAGVPLRLLELHHRADARAPLHARDGDGYRREHERPRPQLGGGVGESGGGDGGPRPQGRGHPHRGEPALGPGLAHRLHLDDLERGVAALAPPLRRDDEVRPVGGRARGHRSDLLRLLFRGLSAHVQLVVHAVHRDGAPRGEDQRRYRSRSPEQIPVFT